MIIAAIIIGLFIIGLIVLIDFLSSRRCGDLDIGVILGVFVTIFFVIEICIIDIIIEEPKPKPKAMDVYQGKTILEYTIRDGEVIDSVVVWKEKTK